jgi:hypothetical protein
MTMKKILILVMTVVAVTGWGGFTQMFARAPTPAEEAIEAEEPIEEDYLYGWIVKRDNDLLQIDDQEYQLAANAEYVGENGQHIGKSRFRTGKYIGFILNEHTQIVKIKLASPDDEVASPQVAPASSGGDSSGSDVYQEDGVWKN